MAYFDHVNISSVEFSLWDKKNAKIRPKSIQGIENNNGWIKIESDDDLPKKSGMYWTFIIGKEVVANTFNTFGNNEFTFDNGVVTHYQPIQKPQPPIY
jgi:hypothetical protein